MDHFSEKYKVEELLASLLPRFQEWRIKIWPSLEFESDRRSSNYFHYRQVLVTSPPTGKPLAQKLYQPWTIFLKNLNLSLSRNDAQPYEYFCNFGAQSNAFP